MMPGSSADVPEAQATGFEAAPALSNIVTSEAPLLEGRTAARASPASSPNGLSPFPLSSSLPPECWAVTCRMQAESSEGTGRDRAKRGNTREVS